MNDVMRKIKLYKIKQIIGESPAPVRICRKVRQIPWELYDYSSYYTISPRTISEQKPTTVDPTDPTDEYKKEKEIKYYGCTIATLLESLGWILPRKEKFHSIHILDAKKNYLFCSISWITTLRFPRNMSVTTTNIYKISKNKLPERIYMTTKKSKEWFKKTTGHKFYSESRKMETKRQILLSRKAPTPPQWNLTEEIERFGIL